MLKSMDYLIGGRKMDRFRYLLIIAVCFAMGCTHQFNCIQGVAEEDLTIHSDSAADKNVVPNVPVNVTQGAANISGASSASLNENE